MALWILQVISSCWAPVSSPTKWRRPASGSYETPRSNGRECIQEDAEQGITFRKTEQVGERQNCGRRRSNVKRLSPMIHLCTTPPHPRIAAVLSPWFRPRLRPTFFSLLPPPIARHTCYGRRGPMPSSPPSPLPARGARARSRAATSLRVCPRSAFSDWLTWSVT